VTKVKEADVQIYDRLLQERAAAEQPADGTALVA
jgi:hypothetical protein